MSEDTQFAGIIVIEGDGEEVAVANRDLIIPCL